jgi:P27 family predicted phage terminase small subunit
MPGPKKTPTETLKIRGSWRAKGRTNEPKPVAGVPECPSWLAGEAKAEWDRQVVDLDQRKLLAKSYRTALVMFCEAWGTYVEALADIRANGHTYITDKGNEVQRPIVGIMHKAFERAAKLGAQFGFSPSAAADLKVNETQEKPSGKSRFFAS